MWFEGLILFPGGFNSVFETRPVRSGLSFWHHGLKILTHPSLESSLRRASPPRVGWSGRFPFTGDAAALLQDPLPQKCRAVRRSIRRRLQIQAPRPTARNATSPATIRPARRRPLPLSPET